MKRNPVTRLGWSNYYAARFGKTGDPQAAHLAPWYFLLDHANMP